MICGTARDGFVRILGGTVAYNTVPGQVGLDYVERIENLAAGPLVLGADDKESPWLFRGGRWVQPALTPPWKLEPEENKERSFKNDRWDDVRVLVGPKGAAITVSGSDEYPGTRVTARQSRSRVEILGREFSKLQPSFVFLTPDEEIWATDSDNLSHFSKGKWEVVSKLPEVPSDEPEFKPSDRGEFPLAGNGLLNIGKTVKSIGIAGPPWILIDQENAHLLRLDYGLRLKSPRLTHVPVRENGKLLQVHDALVWANGSLLLATDKGLRLFELRQGRLSAFTIPSLGEEVTITRLCRDGMGRLWLGGPGLWMIDQKAKLAHDFSELPMTGSLCDVVAFAVDPRRKDAVIVSLGLRGILFLSATPSQGR